MDKLPELDSQQLDSVRGYLRDIALTMGSLQRGFLRPHPKDWQHGLEVTMRGICTQPFTAGGQETYVLLDLFKNKVRFNDDLWKLGEISGAELFDELQTWAAKYDVQLEKPEFSGGQFAASPTEAYAEALWWLERQFCAIKNEIASGLTSPVFLYPHHFDLSLVWFPYENETQIGFGFSAGDETVAEPYIYLTFYPEKESLKDSLSEKLPEGTFWQTEGFRGAVMPYAVLQSDAHPDELLRRFYGQLAAYAVAQGL